MLFSPKIHRYGAFVENELNQQIKTSNNTEKTNKK